MTYCLICHDRGFVPYGISVSPCRCDGGSPDVRRLLREIKTLSGQLNSQNREDIQRQMRDREPARDEKSTVDPRCLDCRGNGFSALHVYTNMDIAKCRKCNGTGTLGKAVPVIERLWYEIDRLYGVINDRDREWAKRFRVETSGKSRYAGRPEQPVEPKIQETDVWKFILGLKDGEDVDKAFKRRAMETHPDRGGTALAFRIVKLAHEKLKGEQT